MIYDQTSFEPANPARLLVPRKPFVSYAQNFEDVMLHRALGAVERGFYVDVEACEPE